MVFTFLGMLVAPWTALSALVRQREAKVDKQAIDFELERSEMARQALDARMRLLTAQAQPHFLFNTLANVQALVEAGSPRAPKLLQSLTEYLRGFDITNNRRISRFDVLWGASVTKPEWVVRRTA